MKVLTVVDPQISLSKMNHVGATMLPYDLCRSLAEDEDIDMSILVYNDLQLETLDGVKIIDLGEPAARYQQQVYKKLCGLVDDYDVIHVHISTPGFVKYMVEFPRVIQKKIIYTMHTWTNSLAVSYFYRDSFKRLVSDSEVNIVFLTEVQRDMLLSKVDETEFYHPERVTIINNAVNVTPLKSTKEDYIIAVGRMVESKGIDKIVNACVTSGQRLLLVSPPWRMTPKEQSYRDRVTKLINNAGDLITWSDGMPHDELMRAISRAKAGIMFSTFDVFSLFILECVNCYTPVLAYNSGSTAEVCRILKDCGVVGFNSCQELSTRLLAGDIPLAKGPESLPPQCRYENFVSHYKSLYVSVCLRTSLRVRYLKD